MSFALEDQHRFLNLSGQLLYGDSTDESNQEVANCETGEWVAMCERDDNHAILSVLVLTEKMARNFDGQRIRCEERIETVKKDIESSSGIMFMVDRKAGKSLRGFHPPEDKLNEIIVGELGRPDGDGKSDERAFVETCFHLARDAKTKMPQVESIPFACMFDIGGDAEYSIFMNPRRDAVGFQIDRKG